MSDPENNLNADRERKHKHEQCDKRTSIDSMAIMQGLNGFINMRMKLSVTRILSSANLLQFGNNIHRITLKGLSQTRRQGSVAGDVVLVKEGGERVEGGASGFLVEGDGRVALGDVGIGDVGALFGC